MFCEVTGLVARTAILLPILVFPNKLQGWNNYYEREIKYPRKKSAWDPAGMGFEPETFRMLLLLSYWNLRQRSRSQATYSLLNFTCQY